MGALVSDLLYKTNLRFLQGSTQIEVVDVQIDSRKVGKGSLFVALKGEQADGHDYIDQVVEQGAVAVVVEQVPTHLAEGVTYIGVADTHEAAGPIIFTGVLPKKCSWWVLPVPMEKQPSPPYCTSSLHRWGILVG